jgi:hypothetical protein
MVRKKLTTLTTFDEKINAFMRMRESSTVYIERDYVRKFGYLAPAEVHDLFVLCEKIEAAASQLAQQVHRGALDRETFRKQLMAEHPYLEEKRVDRLISRSLYWTYA